MIQRAEMVGSLVETFGLGARPDHASEPERYRLWSRTAGVVDALPLMSESEFGPALRRVFDACGQLGDVQTQSFAACVAGALGVRLEAHP